MLVNKNKKQAEAEKTFYQIHLLSQGKQTVITAHEAEDVTGVIKPATARQLLQRIVAAYPGSYPNS